MGLLVTNQFFRHTNTGTEYINISACKRNSKTLVFHCEKKSKLLILIFLNTKTLGAINILCIPSLARLNEKKLSADNFPSIFK